MRKTPNAVSSREKGKEGDVGRDERRDGGRREGGRGEKERKGEREQRWA